MKRIALVLELDDAEMAQIRVYVKEIYTQMRAIETDLQREIYCSEDPDLAELVFPTIKRLKGQLTQLKQVALLFGRQGRKHQLTVDFTQRYTPEMDLYSLYSFVRDHNIDVLAKIDHIAYFANL